MYNFRNDYSEAAHPAVLAAIAAHNEEHVIGYGADQYCARAAQLIRDLCRCPGADVQFLIGGTQTNFTAIAAFLRPWEGAICAHTGHVNGHEGGAVEATGHKLLLAHAAPDGKLTPELILPLVEEGRNEHVVLPKLVYISDATENGAVYTLSELEALSACCKANNLLLFLDGARLGAAFGAAGSDVALPDLARLTDAFYIGGTKNGALMGEALVIVNPALQEGFFRIKKQRGAVLAKGWLLGLQFQTLLEDGLYWTIARHAVDMAQTLQSGLEAMGLSMMSRSASNMVFPVVPDRLLPVLDKLCAYEVWTRQDENHTVIRLVTSFATQAADVEGFLADLKAAL
ncbi:aminotransferase class I/II-fold pyridoxal phosphate-dependent enzyme [uncultured Pseudoflavonifractor sp.]|uniref:threonine aldolase family protein n=1 Tax=uncultured Pseudoflavonifractor sp. TaxID=1221379 RepID=UPI0026002FDE|nr:aminotransferase class I/II-fold pyridoxal phosphate-dependent enzyme [uncultured Pseudoflavonifractor sp.]